jgi:hypothetical protein
MSTLRGRRQQAGGPRPDAIGKVASEAAIHSCSLRCVALPTGVVRYRLPIDSEKELSQWAVLLMICIELWALQQR